MNRPLVGDTIVSNASIAILSYLVHQVSDWCSGVAIKMGRRQGGPSRTGTKGRISESIRNRRATQSPAHFQRSPPGRRPVGCFSALLARPVWIRYGHFARALKNSQLTCGDITIICETVH